MSLEGEHMRSRHEIYDDLLRFQAELSFDLEQQFFHLSEPWERSRTVLDFGSGNAYYAALLAREYPEKSFVCVERDEALAPAALRWIGNNRISLIKGDHRAVPDSVQFDFVIARHVVSYLSDAAQLFSWISRHTEPDAGMLLIDADDAALVVRPRLPILEKGNEDFKRGVRDIGGNREALTTVAADLEHRGFGQQWIKTLIVHSDIRERKYLMYMFMRCIAELDHGSPLNADVWAEIDNWALNPKSYLQYGLVATALQKGRDS
jgi:SAM-dependent methyltransferase